jgi:RNA recognition motif-containing protein
MGQKLYVGNLPYSYTDNDMERAFGAYGTVQSAKIVMDRDSGRSKGFGFVEMASDAEAQAAISGLNGQDIGGRGLVVNEARPMESRPVAVVAAAASAAAVVVVAAASAAVAATKDTWPWPRKNSLKCGARSPRSCPIHAAG